jgi:hypothetical protein
MEGQRMIKKIILIIFCIFVLFSGISFAQNILGPGGQSTFMKDGDGDVATITDTGLQNIHDADFHIDSVSVHLVLPSGTSETIGNSGAAAGVYSFDVDAGQGGTFSANDFVTISEGSVCESDVLKILAVAVDTLTLDRPLEETYTTAAVVEIVDQDMGQANGSVARLEYCAGPPSDEVWHITTMSVAMECGAQPSSELFCDQAVLTRGLIFRVESDTMNRNLHVFRKNGDFREYFGGNEMVYEAKVAGGAWFVYGIWHYKEHTDTIVKLDGATSDTVCAIVSDNLTGPDEFEWIVQGHKEGT